MHVLLSGFEPFDGETINPSLECVRALTDVPMDGVRLSCVELAVDREQAPRAVLERMHTLTPNVIIMLGEAPGRMSVTPERVAINIDDYRIPDHGQRQPQDEPIVDGGPAGYFSTLPIRAMVRALHQQCIPAEISNSAGTYLCNHVFYRIMHELAQSHSKTLAGFIHLPQITEQVIRRRSQGPSVPLSMLLSAVQICINTCHQAIAGRLEDA